MVISLYQIESKKSLFFANKFDAKEEKCFLKPIYIKKGVDKVLDIIIQNENFV